MTALKDPNEPTPSPSFFQARSYESVAVIAERILQRADWVKWNKDRQQSSEPQRIKSVGKGHPTANTHEAIVKRCMALMSELHHGGAAGNPDNDLEIAHIVAEEVYWNLNDGEHDTRIKALVNMFASGYLLGTIDGKNN